MKILAMCAGLMALASAAFAGSQVNDANGMYWKNPNGFPAIETAANAQNPAINGALIQMAWTTLEPARNTFSWTTLDSALANFIAAGRKIKLNVYAGTSTPLWLFSEGSPIIGDFYRVSFANTTTGTYNGLGAKACSNQDEPVPYDPIFEKEWENLITNLQAHLASANELNSVTILQDSAVSEATDEFFVPYRKPGVTTNSQNESLPLSGAAMNISNATYLTFAVGATTAGAAVDGSGNIYSYTGITTGASCTEDGVGPCMVGVNSTGAGTLTAGSTLTEETIRVGTSSGNCDQTHGGIFSNVSGSNTCYCNVDAQTEWASNGYSRTKMENAVKALTIYDAAVFPNQIVPNLVGVQGGQFPAIDYNGNVYTDNNAKNGDATVHVDLFAWMSQYFGQRADTQVNSYNQTAISLVTYYQSVPTFPVNGASYQAIAAYNNTTNFGTAMTSLSTGQTPDWFEVFGPQDLTGNATDIASAYTAMGLLIANQR